MDSIKHRSNYQINLSPALILPVLCALLAAHPSVAQDLLATQRSSPEAPENVLPVPVAMSDLDSTDGDVQDVELEEKLDEELDEELDEDLENLLDMADRDLGQLAQVQVSRPSVAPALDAVVSTVERKTSTVGKTPAAVFVITGEMIRRSGARSIPEALRMAPGVQVARIDGNKWAVSIRGFNGRFANKLLVQIDGRSVYNPLFGGVYWDVQNVLLEDVQRLEVIRGPGGTVWGANAVNGVINIVTKSARDTRGTFAEVGGGNIEGGYSSVRVGRAVAPNADMRTYATWYERSDLVSPTEHDDGRNLQVGARLDWNYGRREKMTLQGDFYDGSSGTASQFSSPTGIPSTTVFDERVSGGNVLFRWAKDNADETGWQLQTYYESTSRDLVGAGAQYDRHTLDIDFQQRIKPWQFHELIWGVGFRANWDQYQAQPYFLSLSPAKSNFNVANLFLQDTLTLVEEELFLSAGSKFSYNDFTGFEVQPSVRLLWTPDETRSLWCSASRAVRTGSRLSRDARITLSPVSLFGTNVYPIVNGTERIEAEDVWAIECGMRSQQSDLFSWDLALFCNGYDDLTGIGAPQGLGIGPEGLILTQSFDNGGNAKTWGVELGTTVQLTQDWSIRTAYTYLDLDIESSQLSKNGDSPNNQLYVQSSHDLGNRLQFDVMWRYVDALFDQETRSYNVLDVRCGWQATDAVEVYAVGQNLLGGNHREFGNESLSGTLATVVPAGVYGGVAVRY